MSNADSFIEEVSEEVRRDKLYGLLKRYGWIAVVLILLVVGGAAWSEWSKAKTRAAAENLGDAMLAALELNDSAARVSALESITPETGSAAGHPVLEFMLAAQQAGAEDNDAAVATLNALATNGDVPEIYRQIAAFKALGLAKDSISATEKRTQYEALARAGAPLRLLAEEQLALLDVEDGNIEGAIERFQSILDDAEVSSGLQQRAAQVIVALGGTPDIAVPANG
ncbi:MAG: tetratricopeptide repeat protein [Paracoccaceae bacterium]